MRKKGSLIKRGRLGTIAVPCSYVYGEMNYDGGIRHRWNNEPRLVDEDLFALFVYCLRNIVIYYAFFFEYSEFRFLV